MAKQKQDIAIRRTEFELQMKQMPIQELKEGHRKHVAVAKLNEAELLNNRFLFSRH